LKGVLIDTDSTRRGDLRAILAEIAWRLHISGRDDVKLCLTGGVSPELIQSTKSYVSSYGVGLNAMMGPLLDFAVQVVGVEGVPKSKIGVQPGKKNVLYCDRCASRVTVPFSESRTCCGTAMASLVREVLIPFTPVYSEVRSRVASLSSAVTS
jgi:nicotinate phosphoribosyltransferase